MEITVIYKLSPVGGFWTAAAFIGRVCAGMATCRDKELAGAQARAYAQQLADAGPLVPVPAEAARLGGSAKVGSFGLHLTRGTRWADVALAAAQLAALDVAVPEVDPAGQLAA